MLVPYVNPPFICAGGGLTRALMSEQFVSRRGIYASTNATKAIPETPLWLKSTTISILIFMSSYSIHDAVLCAERRGRTPARSIDAALLVRLYSRNYDYLIINAVFFKALPSAREVC